VDHDPAELARLCREQARHTLDPWAEGTLLEMADEYEALARAHGEPVEGEAQPLPGDRGLILGE